MSQNATRRNSLSGSSHHNNKPNALQKINPLMWRQNRTVTKALESVDGLVKSMTKGADYLVETPPNKNVTLFRRTEIHTGKLLGEGSFSQVYEIAHLQVNNNEDITDHEASLRQEMEQELKDDKERHNPYRYSLKLPRRDTLRKSFDFAKAVADLVLEASYLSRLDHPNILSLRGVPLGGTHSFEENGKRFDSYFLVTDRLSGTLDERIAQWQREGPPDPARIPRKTNYALQIANALAYLHKRRIIFRDLKPENVGFLGEHTVQLFDFGLVRELPQGFDNEVYAMSGSGSQWYMAVEIFITGKYNLKADVYSWAMTTYEMLTESKPFANMHNLQHVSVVCVQGKRPKLSRYNFPPGLESILRAAWGQTVAKRPSIQSVVRTLEKLIPELGDEAACSWPSVAPDKDNDVAEGVHHDNHQERSDDVDSIEDILNKMDEAIDDELREEMKKGREQRGTFGGSVALGDVADDENDYSLSSVYYEEH